MTDPSYNKFKNMQNREPVPDFHGLWSAEESSSNCVMFLNCSDPWSSQDSTTTPSLWDNRCDWPMTSSSGSSTNNSDQQAAHSSSESDTVYWWRLTDMNQRPTVGVDVGQHREQSPSSSSTTSTTPDEEPTTPEQLPTSSDDLHTGNRRWPLGRLIVGRGLMLLSNDQQDVSETTVLDKQKADHQNNKDNTHVNKRKIKIMKQVKGYNKKKKTSHTCQKKRSFDKQHNQVKKPIKCMKNKYHPYAQVDGVVGPPNHDNQHVYETPQSSTHNQSTSSGNVGKTSDVSNKDLPNTEVYETLEHTVEKYFQAIRGKQLPTILIQSNGMTDNLVNENQWNTYINKEVQQYAINLYLSDDSDFECIPIPIKKQASTKHLNGYLESSTTEQEQNTEVKSEFQSTKYHTNASGNAINQQAPTKFVFTDPVYQSMKHPNCVSYTNIEHYQPQHGTINVHQPSDYCNGGTQLTTQSAAFNSSEYGVTKPEEMIGPEMNVPNQHFVHKNGKSAAVKHTHDCEITLKLGELQFLEVNKKHVPCETVGPTNMNIPTDTNCAYYINGGFNHRPPEPARRLSNMEIEGPSTSNNTEETLFKMGMNGSGVVTHKLPQNFPNAEFSTKVFIGGLPQDIIEEDIREKFQQFGTLSVDWPYKQEAKSKHPPKGFAFLLFQYEFSVKLLVKSCELNEKGNYYTTLSSITQKRKKVEVRPWRMVNEIFKPQPEERVTIRNTVFVGGISRTLTANELAKFMTENFGEVSFVGIDTDIELNYPKGSGRVIFVNKASFLRAIATRFTKMAVEDDIKSIELKPYVLDYQKCDECRGTRKEMQYAQYFCPNASCLKYLCGSCWIPYHKRKNLPLHKPVTKPDGTDRPRVMMFKNNNEL